jgi:hypothetical protein
VSLTSKQKQKRATELGVALDRISDDGGLILYRAGDKMGCPGCGLPMTDVRPLEPCDYCEAVRDAIKSCGGYQPGDVPEAEQKRLKAMADRIAKERA